MQVRKPKGFKGKYGVDLLTMNAFVRAAGISARGRKMPDQIERAFKYFRAERPAGIPLTAYCLSNTSFIREKAQGHFKRNKARAPDKPAAEVSQVDPRTDDFHAG